MARPRCLNVRPAEQYGQDDLGISPAIFAVETSRHGQDRYRHKGQSRQNKCDNEDVSPGHAGDLESIEVG
jgi:hypothetical protein